MSIRRKGNRWEVRLWLGGGKRFERTLPPGATRADARALEAKISREKINAAVGRAPARSIDDAIDQWLATGAKQLKSYDKDLKYRIAVLREYTAKPLNELPATAEKIKQKGTEAGMSAAAINRYLAILRRVGNLAERWGWTDLPLGRRVVLLPESSHRTTFLTPVEVNRLAAKADALIADMIRFAALTGLRRGEMLGLQPDQIRDGLLILSGHTKSNRPRGIPLPPEAAEIAARRLPWGVGAALLRKRFEAARKAAGMPGVRWHDLRHTYASWLVQAGQPLTAVKDLLGHSSLAVTTKYAHLAPVHLAAAVAALPQLGGKAGERRPPGRKKHAA